MIEYVVRPGDNLWEIAQRHRTQLEDLLRANPHISTPNRLYPGERLFLPFIAGRHAPARTASHVSPGASSHGRNNGTAHRSPTDYVVVPGDTLWAIAARLHTTVAALVAANPQITNPNKIYPGQRIHRTAAKGTNASSSSSDAASTAAHARKRAIDVPALLVLIQRLTALRTPYRHGGKAWNFSEEPKDVARRGFDASGFTRYAIGWASNGAIDIGNGPLAQEEWCRKHLSAIPYDDCGKMDGSLRIAFEKASGANGAATHVWLVNQGQTLESMGSVGVTRQSYLAYRNVAAACFLLT